MFVGSRASSAQVSSAQAEGRSQKWGACAVFCPSLVVWPCQLLWSAAVLFTQ